MEYEALKAALLRMGANEDSATFDAITEDSAEWFGVFDEASEDELERYADIAYGDVGIPPKAAAWLRSLAQMEGRDYTAGNFEQFAQDTASDLTLGLIPEHDKPPAKGRGGLIVVVLIAAGAAIALGARK